MADMLSNMKEKKSVLEMAIWSAKTAFLLIGFGFAVVFAVVPSLDLFRSSQRSLLITVQLIIVAIWKLSNARPRGNQPQNHDNNPLAPPPDSPETWYDVPSSPTTTTSPESKSSLSPPAEPVIPPQIVEEEAASSADDENDSMDETWRGIMEGGGLPAKPVLKKSQTWERCKEVEAVGEKAVGRREMRKSETFKEKAKVIVEEGWRRRDVLVVSQDELFRRVETFINKHHENLRLQRQQSEQRRFLEKLRRSY
ncbi:uncharacterized protein LOC103723521 [Phoenix dactylifera]|uniref:Uncharacterized protein LOC103723521 n=1 Tax=Phoenix dactylifera TaxID=42345 RepID=A0A8B7MX01_PHODC|nr:uncharacterized protein LOC103723521 [Phoenix dactylifera]